MQNTETILITGFGPFAGHSINASWEAVKLLTNKNIEGYTLLTEQISVEYKYVDEKIPQLWRKHKPALVIHVGVSSCVNKINLETIAHRTGYCKRDCTNNLHPTGSCCDVNSPECIETMLDVKKICEKFNNSNETIHAQPSENAGRYLCEYVYYKSLNIDRSKALFIHVPALNHPYSAEELANGICQIVKIIIADKICTAAF